MPFFFWLVLQHFSFEGSNLDCFEVSTFTAAWPDANFGSEQSEAPVPSCPPAPSWGCAGTLAGLQLTPSGGCGRRQSGERWVPGGARSRERFWRWWFLPPAKELPGDDPGPKLSCGFGCEAAPVKAVLRPPGVPLPCLHKEPLWFRGKPNIF